MAGAGGTFTLQPSRPLSNGTYSLQAQAIDVAGNVGPLSRSRLTIDTQKPATPGTPALLPADDSGRLGGDFTNVTRPRIVGNAPAGTTVELLSSTGTILGTAAVSSGGTYTITPNAPLPSGVSTETVVAIDVAGNVSAPSPSLSLTIDTTPPPAPSVLSLLATDDSGVVGDGITNVTSPRLTGTAIPYLTIDLISQGGSVLGTTVAGAGGTFTLQPSRPLSNGTYSLQAQAIDVAGECGAARPGISLTIDTQKPATPGTPASCRRMIPGAWQRSSPTSTGRAVVGNTPAGTTVELLWSTGTILGTAAVSSGGTYTITPNAPLSQRSEHPRRLSRSMSLEMSVPVHSLP